MRAQTQGFNVTIHSDYGDGLGDVEVVAPDISRAFLNIITNAFHALHDKLREAADGYDPGLWLTTRRDGDWVEIRIRDNGPGMPASILDKVFEPFFTTKPSGQGTGLGLSISYDIVVQQHGGRLEATSVPGQQTELVIRLPHRQADRLAGGGADADRLFARIPGIGAGARAAPS
jgi:signal transduction histidine kinase